MCVATACPLVHVRGGAPEDIVSASTFPKEQVAVASKSTDVRPKITMACVDCKDRNYITKKNRRNNPDRLELAYELEEARPFARIQDV